MATIVTRTGKGSALTFTEADDNFINLNNDGIANSTAITNLQNDKLDKIGGTVTGTLNVNGNVALGAKLSGSVGNNSQSGTNVTLTSVITEVVRLTNSGLVSVAGIDSPVNGQKVILVNKTGVTINVANDSSSALSANRIFTGNGSDVTLLPNASLSIVYDGSSFRWNVVGGTGSGGGSAGINYIVNTDASSGVVGWSTYNDGASAQPVDGSGGTPPAGLWVSSSTSPLRGSADFNLVKIGTTSYQGSGVAYDFTIDNADLARVLTVSFDYEVISGTYATGDLAVYLIQDPTGTPVVIQPAGFQVVAATAGTKMTQIATFQTDVAQKSYRLCFHVATTSALDYTLALDNIVLGPTQKVYGAPVTDWQSFTPTGSWIANTTYTGRYRRVGDSAEIDIALTLSGAPTSANLTVNFLPPGLSLDTSKISLSGNYARFGVANGADGATGYNLIPIWSSSSAVLIVYQNNTSGAEAVVTQAAPFTWGSGDNVQLTIKVPILGWSSNVEVSSSTDTRVVAARYARSASSAANALVANSYTRVNFDVLTSGGYDTHNAVTTGASWVFTAPVPGQYKISGILSLATAGANGDRILRITGAGVGVYRSLINVPTFGVQISFPISTEVFLSAGQTIFAEAFIPTSATDALINETDRTHITIERLSGPSQIAASETVACEYGTAAGNSFANNTSTFVDFGTKISDTHGSVVGAGSGNNTTATNTWRFVAPISGRYQASAVVTISVPISTSTDAVMVLMKNGAEVMRSARGCYSTSNVALIACSVSGILTLNAGDYISVSFYQSTGATRSQEAISASNKVTIIRVGN